MSDRDRRETVPIEVPLAAVDRKIEQAKVEIRQEFVANLDRQALERAYDKAKAAIEEAKAASAHAEAAAGKAEAATAANLESRATSQRRWIKILVLGPAIAAVLAIGLVGLAAVVYENRARLAAIERMIGG